MQISILNTHPYVLESPDHPQGRYLHTSVIAPITDPVVIDGTEYTGEMVIGSMTSGGHTSWALDVSNLLPERGASLPKNDHGWVPVEIGDLPVWVKEAFSGDLITYPTNQPANYGVVVNAMNYFPTFVEFINNTTAEIHGPEITKGYGLSLLLLGAQLLGADTSSTIDDVLES